MKYPKSELYFLYAFLLVVFITTFFIFRPFIYTLILAGVVAVVFDSIHTKISKITRGKGNLSALIATLFVLLVVILPIGYIGAQILQETSQLYTSIVGNDVNGNVSIRVSNGLQAFLRSLPVPIELSSDFNQYIRQSLNFLLSNLGPLFTNVTKVIVNIFIFLLALFYLFKDGEKLKAMLVEFSPLQDIHDEKILNKVVVAINSVIKGSLFIAIIQGVLTALGFYIFGVPNYTLWGTVAIVAALIPSFGTSLVFIPAVIYLYFTSNIVSVFGLIAWGIAAVGLIDNFLGPKLVGRGILIHPFLILLSIVGGMILFGPLGFLLGPVVLSLSFVLLDIHNSIKGKYTE